MDVLFTFGLLKPASNSSISSGSFTLCSIEIGSFLKGIITKFEFMPTTHQKKKKKKKKIKRIISFYAFMIRGI